VVVEEDGMSEDNARGVPAPAAQAGSRSGRFLGSLKEALVAAGREDNAGAAPRPDPSPPREAAVKSPPPLPAALSAPETRAAEAEPPAATPVRREPAPSAAEAAREVKGQASLKAPERTPPERHLEVDVAPTTRVQRGGIAKPAEKAPETPAKTQLVRGRQALKRGEFQQDPVVGWLVVVGGPGLGSYRPIFEGNNTVGRADSNRVPLDFGDGAISSEEQAYIRYDAADRSFLFVPNLAKTNVVSVNDRRPTGAVPLESMDVIVMGRTQLVFVPFCGPDFDWSEITETKG
jgi:hypothetical protein